jgi:protein sidekick
MSKGPENRTVLEGNDVTLFCEVGGAPMPNVTWYRNGKLDLFQKIFICLSLVNCSLLRFLFLTEREEVVSQGRFQVLDTGSLLIAAVRSRDAGHYTCIRANVAGTVIGSADVSVLVRTQIIQPPADTQVILGHVATLQCKVSSDPALPYDIEWEHNDDAIVPGMSNRIIIHLDGTLEVREVRASDVGNYKCIVRSQGGHDERIAMLKIIELPYPPSNVVADKLPILAPVCPYVQC